MTRRWLHHAMFYGFLLCFAATCVGFVYHAFLGWEAPYPLISVPVMLGTVGGVALMAGTGGLFSMKLVDDPVPAARNLLGADVALLLLLALAAATGLALLGLRCDRPGWGSRWQCIWDVILALFLLLPYSQDGAWRVPEPGAAAGGGGADGGLNPEPLSDIYALRSARIIRHPRSARSRTLRLKLCFMAVSPPRYRRIFSGSRNGSCISFTARNDWLIWRLRRATGWKLCAAAGRVASSPDQ